MPKLWNDTIDAHRQAVRQAVLEATWALVHERGLAAVTMSEIAQKTGIGRATLYKYFPDVEAILIAWHESHVAAHLELLAKRRGEAKDPAEQLEAVLEGVALIAQKREHAGELSALLHRGEHVARAEKELLKLIRKVIVANSGRIRTDVSPDELAAYCLHGRRPADC